MEIPTHKVIHIGKSHQPTHKPKLAKEYVFANADRKGDEKERVYNIVHWK